MVDAIHPFDGTVTRDLTIESRDASISEAAPISLAVVVGFTRNGLAEAAITPLIIGAVLVIAAFWTGHTEVTVADGSWWAICVGPALDEFDALVSQTLKAVRTVAIVLTFDIIAALPNQWITDLTRWAIAAVGATTFIRHADEILTPLARTTLG